MLFTERQKRHQLHVKRPVIVIPVRSVHVKVDCGKAAEVYTTQTEEDMLLASK